MTKYVLTLEDALMGRAWAGARYRPSGYIVQADRRSDADRIHDGLRLAAFAIRVRPYESEQPEYWQTVYLQVEEI